MHNIIHITLFVLLPWLTLPIWGPTTALTVLVLSGATLFVLVSVAYLRRSAAETPHAPLVDTGFADFPDEALDSSPANLAGLRRELAWGMAETAGDDLTIGELLGLEQGLR